MRNSLENKKSRGKDQVRKNKGLLRQQPSQERERGALKAKVNIPNVSRDNRDVQFSKDSYKVAERQRRVKMGRKMALRLQIWNAPQRTMC